MTTLTIEIPQKSEKTLSDSIEQLGGKVLSKNADKKSGKADKKKQILDDLEESIKWVKLHEEGKVKGKPIQDLLNEL
ncbi:MAG TPA: hypothetical protein VIM89_09735 [Mucilaginibacter sp.]